MTRHVLQRRIVRVTQREVVQYTCDTCGSVCGTRDNPKTTAYGPQGKVSHFCRRPGHWRIQRAVADAGGWEEWLKGQVLEALAADHRVSASRGRSR